MAVTAGNAIVAALRDDVDRLLAAEPEVRDDAWDSVHQMRVATRRLRSVLRSYRGLFDHAPVAVIQDELKWLADLLGVARDAEVRAERFAALLAAHAPPDEFARLAVESSEAARSGDGSESARPSVSVKTGDSSGTAEPTATADSSEMADSEASNFTGSAGYVPGSTESIRTELVGVERARYEAAHAEILAALDGDRYRRLRERLSEWRTDPPLDRGQGDKPAAQIFERILRKDRKRLRRLVYAEPVVTPAERVELLHDIRKSAKRLRYSCEGAAEVLGAAATELGNNAKRLQSVLGDHRDAVESRAAILARATESNATGVNATIFELLADAEEVAAGRALAKYPAAAAFVSAD